MSFITYTSFSENELILTAMDQEAQIKIAQARTVGFAQGLINRGCPEEEAVKLAHAYMEPTNGMFQKRANHVANFLGSVATCVNYMRSAK